MKNKNIYAVIVAFNHDDYIINILIKNLLICGVNILIVNNSNKSIKYHDPRIDIIFNKENLGLSKALNIGINYCLEFSPELILLFDQDSCINELNLNKLINEASFNFKNNDVAAIGPSFHEEITGKLYGFPHYKFLKISSSREKNIKYSNPLYLITSGTVLNPRFIRQIGLMDEKFFIDYIDIEWGLRAKHLGYRLIGLNEVFMNHIVGEKYIKILFYSLSYHNSTRLYYQIKNSLLITSFTHIPIRWKIANGILTVKRIIFYTIINKSNFKVILKAIKDGIC